MLMASEPNDVYKRLASLQRVATKQALGLRTLREQYKKAESEVERLTQELTDANRKASIAIGCLEVKEQLNETLRTSLAAQKVVKEDSRSAEEECRCWFYANHDALRAEYAKQNYFKESWIFAKAAWAAGRGNKP